MQIVSNADNLHEMSNMFNGKIRKKKILKCRLLEILPRVLSVKKTKKKKKKKKQQQQNNKKQTNKKKKKKKQKKRRTFFLTENNYFALHSHIPYVLEKNVL